MNKIIYGIIIVILLVIIGVLIFRSPKAKETGGSTQNDTNSAGSNQPASLLSGDIAMKDAVATLYYGNGCHFCADLEKWLQDNKYLPAGSVINQSTVDSWISQAKVKFNIKEVWYNKENSAEMTSKATSCGLSSAGVPFLYDSVNNKCSSNGVPDVEKYFSGK